MIRTLPLVFFSLVYAVTSPSLAQGTAQLEEPPMAGRGETVTALAPVPRDDKWWQDRHAAKLAEKQGNEDALELVFIGDSITHSWESTGKQLWAERFAPLGAINLGYSGDRTEHVLWRLGVGDAGEENNEVGGLSPKLFVLMIGTNNTGHNQNPAQETAAGIVTIVDRLQDLSPESQVLLLAIFPRGATLEDPLRQLNTQINDLIAPLGDREQVTYLDISEVFLDDNGDLPTSVMADLLHPGEAGYLLWADAIRADVERLMAD